MGESALSAAALNCFVQLAEELRMNSGQIAVGASFVPSIRGHLPALKRAGLVVTEVQDDLSQRGNAPYIRLTDGGRALAATYGIDVQPPKPRGGPPPSAPSPPGWQHVSLKK
jgi:hypothetical protein